MEKDVLSVLYTKSSEVARMNCFNSRSTLFVPDFLVIFIYFTLFLSSFVLDIIIVHCLFFKDSIYGAVFLITIFLHSLCGLFLSPKKLELFNSSFSKAFLCVIYLLGFFPIVISLRILNECMKFSKKIAIVWDIFPFQFFYISDENFTILKTYSFICVVLKSIPQLFILSVCILEHKVTGNFCFLFVASMIINMMIFSHTIASMLPIRKTPVIFKTSACVVLNAVNKFLATLCACCMHLSVFAILFKEMKFYAILAHFIKSLIWGWPCWHVLNSAPIYLSNFHFSIYMFFFLLIFGFIYIHPFEGKGNLHYYFFYLLSFCGELYLIYLWCDATIQEITYYFTLKLLKIGFLSCFELTNIMLKYKTAKLGFHNNQIVITLL